MNHPTIEDVAGLAGVSIATVSRALRGLPNVAPSTRERVVAAASALDYESDPTASRLASGRMLTVGVIAPLFGTWYADRVVGGAERQLASAGYDLLLAAIHHRDNLDSFLTRARSFGRRVDATLLVDLYVPEDVSAILRAAGGPMLSVGDRISGMSSLGIDNRAAAGIATDHLIDLGHRRIGLIESTTDRGFLSPAPSLRRRGYAAALERAGVAFDEAIVANGHWTVEGGARAVEELLAAPDPPTALFCMSDQMAIGARRRATQLGRSVPRDLSIIGFDDHELSAAFEITTIRQDVTDMGRRAATHLLAAIDGAGPLTHETLPVELVVRTSTAPAPA